MKDSSRPNDERVTSRWDHVLFGRRKKKKEEGKREKKKNSVPVNYRRVFFPEFPCMFISFLHISRRNLIALGNYFDCNSSIYRIHCIFILIILYPRNEKEKKKKKEEKELNFVIFPYGSPPYTPLKSYEIRWGEGG